MNNTQFLQAFNNHFQEFLDDIVRVFPNDMTVSAAVIGLTKLRKINPRLIIIKFKSAVSEKYGEQILAGDLQYFLEKDYNTDLSDSSQSDAILDKINKLKIPLANMEKADKDSVTKYLQNLCKLSNLYTI